MIGGRKGDLASSICLLWRPTAIFPLTTLHFFLSLPRTRWYHYLLHNQTAALIKAFLLCSGFQRIVVIDVPWYLSA